MPLVCLPSLGLPSGRALRTDSMATEGQANSRTPRSPRCTVAPRCGGVGAQSHPQSPTQPSPWCCCFPGRVEFAATRAEPVQGGARHEVSVQPNLHQHSLQGLVQHTRTLLWLRKQGDDKRIPAVFARVAHALLTRTHRMNLSLRPVPGGCAPPHKRVAVSFAPARAGRRR